MLSGRWIRHHLLIGPDGAWRDDLWLEQYLPEAGSADDAGAAKPSRPVLTAPLDINSCSVDSLTLLPRVGPVLAARIEDQRREGMIFRSLADLQQVKGIGPAMAARLETLVVFAAAPPAKNDSTRISP